jgi:aspartate kinase
VTALDEHHVSGKQLHVSTSGRHATLVVSRENLHDEANVRAALGTSFGEKARFVDGLGAVSAIGAGINATYGNVRAGFSALRDAAIDPLALSTSSFRITWMVPTDSIAPAVRALHARFIEAEAPLVP